MKALLFGYGCFLLSFSLQAQHRILLRTPLEYGVAQDGQRVGIWRYYDYPGRLGMEIDYGNLSLLYFRPDSGQFVIQDGDRWIKQKLLRPCRIHGSEMTLIEHYDRELRTPFELQRRANDKKQVLETTLTFDVGPEGSAVNPVISGYTGFGMGKMMQKAFNTAPNFWIPGIKNDGSPANCRFGISIKICPDSCTRAGSDSYRRLYGIELSKKEPPLETRPVAIDPTAIRFAPDDRWIFVDAKLMARTGGNGFLVIPAQYSPSNQPTRQILYGSIQNGYWLDNRRIAFNYRYSIAKTQQGIYDVDMDSVGTQPDSITYFDRISPDRSLICLVDYEGKQGIVYLANTTNSQRTKLPLYLGPNPIPLAWSPDQKSLVFTVRKDGIDLLYLYEIETGNARQLPIMGAQPCGWSTDGRLLYLFRRNSPFQEPSGELFSLNIESLAFYEVVRKTKGLLFAEYSPLADKFLTILNDDLYLVTPGDLKWHLLIDKVSTANWSNDGKHIGYISEKGTFLNLYDVTTGQTRILHSQLPDKK